jgi:DNA repair exonuclease SbcCD ATPase subunit
LIKELEKVRHEVLQKKSENENARAKNKELEHELERLENYAHQVRENIQDMMADYRVQFESLTKTVEENNKEIDFIRL